MNKRNKRRVPEYQSVNSVSQEQETETLLANTEKELHIKATNISQMKNEMDKFILEIARCKLSTGEESRIQTKISKLDGERYLRALVECLNFIRTEKGIVEFTAEETVNFVRLKIRKALKRNLLKKS